ncbi:phage holin family protein [Auritidibacter sp. NML130574]|uniref:phage holin family protein n=1 Tax=Auritidibacter sp. NML130574 TaxID=2170745 RepID=UPI000D733B85|nr:phage holin family protein [Auritidibacter sp. NML130574]AXR75193.1 phage holin family protein [Auritidibacter sp. NML130574]
MRFLLNTAVTAVAVWLATWLLPGMYFVGASSTGEEILGLLGVSVIFGVVNAVIGPFLRVLSLPVTCLTLGLFTLVINAVLLWLSTWISQVFPVHLEIDEFWFTAIFAAIIISLASAIMQRVLAALFPPAEA